MAKNVKSWRSITWRYPEKTGRVVQLFSQKKWRDMCPQIPSVPSPTVIEKVVQISAGGTVHRGVKCHFSVQGILYAGITWKTDFKALECFLIHLRTCVFAVIEIYLSRMVLQPQVCNWFDVCLTKKYPKLYFEWFWVCCIIS